MFHWLLICSWLAFQPYFTDALQTAPKEIYQIYTMHRSRFVNRHLYQGTSRFTLANTATAAESSLSSATLSVKLKLKAVGQQNLMQFQPEWMDRIVWEFERKRRINSNCTSQPDTEHEHGLVCLFVCSLTIGAEPSQRMRHWDEHKTFWRRFGSQQKIFKPWTDDEEVIKDEA